MPLPLPTSDAAWHARLHPAWRAAADLQFTELSAVARVSDWLVASVTGPGKRFVDLGSGAGKFCLAAAERHPDHEWHGVELRPDLVAEAVRWRVRHGIGNACFHGGDITHWPLDGFDGAYLFNPFAELLDPRPDLGAGLGHGTAAFRRAGADLRQNLRAAPSGFALATYFVEEAQVPSGFRCVFRADKLLGWEHLPGGSVRRSSPR